MMWDELAGTDSAMTNFSSLGVRVSAPLVVYRASMSVLILRVAQMPGARVIPTVPYASAEAGPAGSAGSASARRSKRGLPTATEKL